MCVIIVVVKMGNSHYMMIEDPIECSNDQVKEIVADMLSRTYHSRHIIMTEAMIDLDIDDNQVQREFRRFYDIAEELNANISILNEFAWLFGLKTPQITRIEKIMNFLADETDIKPENIRQIRMLRVRIRHRDLDTVDKIEKYAIENGIALPTHTSTL